MKKNVASQVVGAQLVNATTGAAFTSAVTVSVTGDGGTQATGSVGSGACTHEGNGFHTYAPAQAETNYDHVAFTFTGTGAVPVTVQIYTTFPQTGDSFARVGAPAGASVSADVAAIKTETASILADTATLPTATPGTAGGLFIAGTNAATTITTSLTTTFTGNLTGSVGSVTGAVGSVTGAVGSVTGNVGGNVTGSVGSVASGGITEASYATTAGTFAPLSIVDQGTAQSATGTTLVLRAAAAFADSDLVGARVLITGGSAGVGQSRLITANVGATDTVTVAAWTTTPTGTITYKIFSDTASSGSGLDAAATRAALGMASANLDTQLSALQSDTDNIQTRIPAALVSGRMDASVGAMAANVMTAAAAAADLTTELQTGLSTLDAAGVRAAVGLATANLDTQLGDLPTNAELSTALGTADDAVLTVVNAIKLKTDNLPSGVSRNTPLDNFQFLMVLDTDHVSAAAGLTVTAQRCIDSGTFGACTNAVTEISNGFYRIDLSASDLNGAVVTFLFTATGADARAITITTEPP